MMEVDQDGLLLIAGKNRIGRLVDANNPNSLFDPNYIQLATKLSRHYSPQNSHYMEIYLLPDQIDGENYNEVNFTNQFPETLTVCSFPYQITSNFSGNWSHSYIIPGSEPPVYQMDELGYGLSKEIPNEGTVYLIYSNENSCTVAESIYIELDPIVKYGADFTYNTTYDLQGQLEIELVPSVSVGITSVWKLFKEVNGSWVLLTTLNGQPGGITPIFTGLDPTQSYQVKHEITAIQPYACNYSPFKIKIIQ